MAARPENEESLTSVAEQVIWAFATYGLPRGIASGARPVDTMKEAIRSVADAVVWAWSS